MGGMFDAQLRCKNPRLFNTSAKLRVGGFETRRTRAAVPHYARAGVVLLSEGGYGDHALEWPTTSMRASPTLFLTGTVSLDIRNS